MCVCVYECVAYGICKQKCREKQKTDRLKLHNPIMPSLCLSLQNTEEHLAFLITVPAALFFFLSIFILVCIESVFKRMLGLFSLLIWACLVIMGYLFMFSGGILSPWDQVDESVSSFYVCMWMCVPKKKMQISGIYTTASLIAHLLVGSQFDDCLLSFTPISGCCLACLAFSSCRVRGQGQGSQC